MPDTRRFLTALRRVIRPSPTASGGDSARPAAATSTDAAWRPPADGGEEWPGRTGPSATVELDPAGVRRVRFAYTPERDGEPDPGEVVWTWVPYEERDGRGKDRPVAVVAAGADGRFLAVQLTSKPQDGNGDAVALGAGGWDGEGRPSWARIDRVFLVHAEGMRREAASLDAERYALLVDALAARYGWG
ncbi:type II toxin-antitoxin system PemK/MazF family toxin [Agromyces binzhouensis]|uniref:type II toxin-antitoxin system PemK/MazF family toxin n=1 Tax=Agromyces binzhouensis TaxID=1817495 RepID=UPI001F5D1F6B|nr:type II toxin-antitoxin system PemK/MazF family toxin [Agromyces binzhouensis]